MVIQCNCRVDFELNDDEIQILEAAHSRLALLEVRNMAGLPADMDDISLTQFLSSEQGNRMYAEAEALSRKFVKTLRSEPRRQLHLVVDPTRQIIQGKDAYGQQLIRVLEERLPPSKTLFSYFPADRVMPAGEVAVQLGAADGANQLKSHMAQPELKYNRLKHLIVSRSLLGDIESLREDFTLIFEKLLPGKALRDLAISPIGNLTVRIEESPSGRVYDIDRMSSGEKGLVLQFLLMRRSLDTGGVILIDEPELHLNPAVCSRLLPFFSEHVAEYGKVQILICTHSPEILASAFENPRCDLFHLRSRNDLSPVFREDRPQVFEALSRLGSSASDILFSRGTIFVEGADDSILLEAGFSQKVGSYKLQSLQGRGQVEKEIETLQKAEKKGDLKEPQYFVFDLDRKVTNLKATNLVRVIQWERYCFENYLLDHLAVFDAIQTFRANSAPESRGAVRTRLMQLAMEQLSLMVVRDVYSDLEPPNPGLRPSEIRPCKNFESIGEILANRLAEIRQNLDVFNIESWVQDFRKRANQKREELAPEWEERWFALCDGKRVLSDFHKELGANVSLVEFKRQIMLAMKGRKSESWRAAESLLSQLVGA